VDEDAEDPAWAADASSDTSENSDHS
jgi:hypothetical protein